jgi:hypothetical protein
MLAKKANELTIVGRWGSIVKTRSSRQASWHKTSREIGREVVGKSVGGWSNRIGEA